MRKKSSITSTNSGAPSRASLDSSESTSAALFGEAAGCGVPLFSHPDSVNLHQKKFPLVMAHVWEEGEVSFQPHDELRKNLRMIPHLEGDDPLIIRRGVNDDVSKISVQGKQNRIQILSFCYHRRIR